MEWQELIEKFKLATGLSETEIAEKVQALPLAYEPTLNFFLEYGRFPDTREANIYKSYGVERARMILAAN